MQGAILECAQCLLPVTGQRSNSLYGIQVDCNRLARANPINGSRSAPNWLESIRLNHLLQLDWLWLNIYRCIDDIHLRSIEISCVATLPLFIALFSGTADDVTASVFHRRFQVNASRSIDWIQSGLFSPVDRGFLELFFFILKWCAVNVCRSKPAVEVLNCWDARAIFTILRIQFQTNCSNCVHLIKLRWWRRLQKISLIFWKKRFVGYILTSKWPVELLSSRDLSAIFTILMFDF